jgi:hypothetical protein
VGVGQPVRIAAPSNFRFGALSPFDFCFPPWCVEFFESPAIGVGHPVNSLPDVRGADARSAEIDRPDGVTLTFQVRV